jgi:uncharacterized protein YeaO (DUF488 family)
MTLAIVKLGTPRKNRGQELRLGTVRRPPRGIRKQDYARLDYYDVWLPVLSPSPELVKFAHAAQDEKSWDQFKKKFKTEMAKPEAAHILDLIATLSHRMTLSLGCYCDDENHCHRSVLRDLLKARGAALQE